MKKMAKLFSLLSAAVMSAVCMIPTSAETDAESRNRKQDELAAQLPEPREIDPADPNYPIRALLETQRTSIDNCGWNRAVNQNANDENGKVITHAVYVPDEGVSVHETYSTGKNNSVEYDIISWYQAGSVVINPYKAYTYLQQDMKDLNGNYLDTAGACFTHVWGCTAEITPAGANESAMQTAFINSSSEAINIDAGAGDIYEGNDKFEVRYFLNEDGGAVVTDIRFAGMRTNMDDILSKDIFPVPTVIQDNPVAEILPGTYAYVCPTRINETEEKILYVDPFAETEPVSLVAEVKFGDGDITDDGEFSVSDAVYGARMIAEDKTLQVSDTGRAAADMDANGKVDTKDLGLMLNLLAKAEI